MAILSGDTTIGGKKISELLTGDADTVDGKHADAFVEQDSSGNVTITGNLRLKKSSSNYGNKLNFGDSEYVYLHEASDDILTIKAKKLILTISDETVSIHCTVSTAAPTATLAENRQHQVYS